MARKSQKPKPPVDPPMPIARQRGRPKLDNPSGRLPIGVSLRGSEKWVKWIDSVAAILQKRWGPTKQVDRTDVIDAALASFAKTEGLDEPPKRF